MQQQKPNILVIMGDDIGIWNISVWNRGIMGEHAHDFTRRPPLLGQLPGRGHVERLCEATGVDNDMDELCQKWWSSSRA